MMITNICQESYGCSTKTTIALLNKNQEITLFFDEEIDCTPNNQQFFDELSKYLNNGVDIDKLLIEIANEVAEECFCQSDEKPDEQEILAFAKDLLIVKINVFLDDVVLYLIAPTFLPDLVITCQVGFSNHIENLELVEKRFISFAKMLDNH